MGGPAYEALNTRMTVLCWMKGWSRVVLSLFVHISSQ